MRGRAGLASGEPALSPTSLEDRIVSLTKRFARLPEEEQARHREGFASLVAHMRETSNADKAEVRQALVQVLQRVAGAKRTEP